jgi:uncharacterized ferredoxin-like protein
MLEHLKNQEHVQSQEIYIALIAANSRNAGPYRMKCSICGMNNHNHIDCRNKNKREFFKPRGP